MKKVLLISCVFLLSGVIKSQPVDSLKRELSYFYSGEKYGDKIALARTLHKKSPFDHQAIDYICRYYDKQKIDSTDIFLNKIIEDYPDSAKAYISKAKYIYFLKEVNYEREKEKCLKQGYLVDSLNVEVNYMLAELYYQDFLKPYCKLSWGIGIDDDRNKFSSDKPLEESVFNNPEDEALFYLYHLEKIDPGLKKIVYFPIQQLQRYKNKNLEIEDIHSIDDNCYFPVWYFLNLTDNWADDLSKDYLFEVERSPAEWLSKFLQDIDEPCLYKNDEIESQNIFRFTWLRTFHNPVCLRLENNNGIYTLYWKLLDGAGGYDPGEIIVSKSRRLSLNEWDQFITLFERTKFKNLLNEIYFPMNDGASWTLEYKTSDSFKTHDTNVPSGEIVKCCKYLLNLTDLKIKEKDIY